MTKCDKCGDCCRHSYPGMMIYENLTTAQKQEVWRPREEMCCQLAGNLCNIEVMFGHEAKPDVCQQAECRKERR
jgi:hypothetical protein